MARGTGPFHASHHRGMPTTVINGVRLYWEQRGARGDPVVLVHGAWVDHHNWDAVVPALATSFRVFTYDRRGHSRSERPPTQGSVEEDVADLLAFIGMANIAPAHVIGNSGGAVIALKLAAARPDVFASVVAHEPPFLGLIRDHPLLPSVRQRMNAVLDLLRAGDMEAGARQFVETIAFGPGMWATLPPEMRQTFVLNAPTFLDELNEPEDVLSVDLPRLAEFRQPILITQGGQSAPFFAVILDKIAAALPRADRHTGAQGMFRISPILTNMSKWSPASSGGLPNPRKPRVRKNVAGCCVSFGLSPWYLLFVRQGQGRQHLRASLSDKQPAMAKSARAAILRG